MRHAIRLVPLFLALALLGACSGGSSPNQATGTDSGSSVDTSSSKDTGSSDTGSSDTASSSEDTSSSVGSAQPAVGARPHLLERTV